MTLRTSAAGTTGAAGGGFEASHGHLVSASQHVHDVAGAINQELTWLMNALVAMEGAWKGSAAAAFDAVKLKWSDDQRRLTMALDAIGEMLQGSGVAYQGADDEGQVGMQKIRNLLGA